MASPVQSVLAHPLPRPSSRPAATRPATPSLQPPNPHPLHSAIYTSVVLLPSALALFYLFGATSPSAWLLLAAFLALTFTPLQLTTGALSERFVQFSVARAAAYFPTRVVVTDPEVRALWGRCTGGCWGWGAKVVGAGPVGKGGGVVWGHEGGDRGRGCTVKAVETG